jgi:hypothetical protein
LIPNVMQRNELGSLSKDERHKWARIPLFADVLAAVPDSVALIVELKGPLRAGGKGAAYESNDASAGGAGAAAAIIDLPAELHAIVRTQSPLRQRNIVLHALQVREVPPRSPPASPPLGRFHGG